MLRCFTGSKALDELFLGGIETQAVTEFYGEFGSGKSQICHTLCATARQSIDSGGMDSGVIYIDTEGTFRPERVEQIARARGLDHRHVLKSVAVCKVYNSSHLELIVKDLGRYINEFKAKLVIIDSIISLHRAEFWEEVLWPIDNKNSMVCYINSLDWQRYSTSLRYNQPSSILSRYLLWRSYKRAGGNILGHSSTYRIYLRKSGENRVAKMMDSPYHPYSDTRFTLNEKGTDDIEEEGLKKTKTNSKRRVDDED